MIFKVLNQVKVTVIDVEYVLESKIAKMIH